MFDQAAAAALEDDYEHVARCDGLFVGLLSDDERAAFDRLCAAGRAGRSHVAFAGFIGLAKVELWAP